MWVNTFTKVFVTLVTVVLLCGVVLNRSFKYVRIQSNPFQVDGSTKKPNHNRINVNLQNTDLNSSKEDVTFPFDNFNETTTLMLEETTEIPTKYVKERPKIVPDSPEVVRESQETIHKTLDMLIERGRQWTNKTGEMTKLSSDGRKDRKFVKIEDTQRDKVQHFWKNCRKLLCEDDVSNENLNLFFSSEHKLAWKLIPKIGSTFLIQAFGILNDMDNKSIFHKARSSVHVGGGKFSYKQTFRWKTLEDYIVLLMARNPFSRLFSAYIDKVFLPNTISLPRALYKRYRKKNSDSHCPFNNTFNEFLDYALNDKIRHRVTIGHYGPMVASNFQCSKLCRIPKPVIVNQESFSDDVDYALKHVGVERKKYDIIYKAMHEKNVKSTIPGIVKTVYQKMKLAYMNRKFRRQVSENCLSWPDIVRRLWKSFQIQGYIHDKSDFPAEEFTPESRYKDASYTIDVILQEINKHPLTHEQKVDQRSRAMVKAFAAVSEETVAKIEEIYYYDFNLYGYNRDLIQG